VFRRRLHGVNIDDVGRGHYRICVEAGARKYVAWKAWDGFILADDPGVACPFKTPKLARKIGQRWTDAGDVFVDRIRRS
jgi:hypothetical protein